MTTINERHSHVLLLLLLYRRCTGGKLTHPKTTMLTEETTRLSLENTDFSRRTVSTYLIARFDAHLWYITTHKHGTD